MSQIRNMLRYRVDDAQLYLKSKCTLLGIALDGSDLQQALLGDGSIALVMIRQTQSREATQAP